MEPFLQKGSLGDLALTSPILPKERNKRPSSTKAPTQYIGDMMILETLIVYELHNDFASIFPGHHQLLDISSLYRTSPHGHSPIYNYMYKIISVNTFKIFSNLLLLRSPPRQPSDKSHPKTISARLRGTRASKLAVVCDLFEVP